MISRLAAALGQAARQASASFLWRMTGVLIAFFTAFIAFVAAIGFATVGCYLLLLDAFPLSPAAAAFVTGGALLAIALIALAVLRRNLFSAGGAAPRQEVTDAVSEEARRTVRALEVQAAEAVARRPATSLLACGIAGLLVDAMRRPPRS